jgi:hypothetical protein
MKRQTVTLEEVKHKLEAWRAIKPHPSAKIPQELWSYINQLFAHSDYKRTTIIKELRLGTNQLLREVQGFTTKQCKSLPLPPQHKQNFVKAPLAPLLAQPLPQQGLTLVNIKGVKLSISAPTSEQFSMLITLFMEP